MRTPFTPCCPYALRGVSGVSQGLVATDSACGDGEGRCVGARGSWKAVLHDHTLAALIRHCEGVFRFAYGTPDRGDLCASNGQI